MIRVIQIHLKRNAPGPAPCGPGAFPIPGDTDRGFQAVVPAPGLSDCHSAPPGHPNPLGGEHMVMARPQPCAIPGCRNLATTGARCVDHPRKAWENPSANTRTLTRGQRHAFRRMILARDTVCQCDGWCDTHHGRCTAAATEADHIVPISQGGAHMDPTNGSGLCTPCHGIKTQREARTTRRRR